MAAVEKQQKLYNFTTQKSIKLLKIIQTINLTNHRYLSSAHHLTNLDFRNKVQIITNRKCETSNFGI